MNSAGLMSEKGKSRQAIHKNSRKHDLWPKSLEEIQNTASCSQFNN